MDVCMSRSGDYVWVCHQRQLICFRVGGPGGTPGEQTASVYCLPGDAIVTGIACSGAGKLAAVNAVTPDEYFRDRERVFLVHADLDNGAGTWRPELNDSKVVDVFDKYDQRMWGMGEVHDEGESRFHVDVVSRGWSVDVSATRTRICYEISGPEHTPKKRQITFRHKSVIEKRTFADVNRKPFVVEETSEATARWRQSFRAFQRETSVKFITACDATHKDGVKVPV
jgi:hypothetical protein